MNLELSTLAPGASEIRIVGDIDLYNASTVKELVIRLWNKGEKQFLVNLSEVSSIDSSGIGVLIYIYTGCRTRNLSALYFGATSRVARILSQTKLDGFLPFADSREEAVSRLGIGLASPREAEEIRRLVVDPSSPLFDTSDMFFKEFHIDLSQVRRLAGLIVQKAPAEIREINILEQQVSEIIKNAVQHGNSNDREKAVRIWFAFTPFLARLIVEDEGTGFEDLERWNDFYRRKIECYRNNRFDEMMDYLSFRTDRSEDSDGGNALFAAIEFWNDGVVFNQKRNAVAVQRRLR